MVDVIMQVNPTPPSNVLAMFSNALDAVEADKLINSTEKTYFNSIKTILNNFTTWASLKISLESERVTVVADDNVVSPYVQMTIDGILSDCDFVIKHSLESTLDFDVGAADGTGLLTGLGVGWKVGRPVVGALVGCALYSSVALLDNYLT